MSAIEKIELLLDQIIDSNSLIIELANKVPLNERGYYLDKAIEIQNRTLQTINSLQNKPA